jgi:hypothetical protein
MSASPGFDSRPMHPFVCLLHLRFFCRLYACGKIFGVLKVVLRVWQRAEGTCDFLVGRRKD